MYANIIWGLGYRYGVVWFAIAGPRDSEFEGGIYHRRIQLPAEYPFKPPSFLLLIFLERVEGIGIIAAEEALNWGTPTGRFETQTKICLSISNHHPSWSVRTASVALIAFMPTIPYGALGFLDYPIKEWRILAIKSREAPLSFGSPDRQKMINEIHQYMLGKAPMTPQTNMPDQ